MTTLVRFSFYGLLVLALLGVLVSCSDDDSPTDPGSGGENEIQNSLAFTRQDDSVLAMGDDYAICCGIWEEGYIDKDTLKILFYGPDLDDSFWKLFIVVDEVEVGTTYNFPTADDDPVKIFLLDASTSNELSGDADDSAGTITITSMGCDSPLTVELTIDATIGSEFSQAPTVHISGTFSATVHSNPSPFGCDFSM